MSMPDAERSSAVETLTEICQAKNWDVNFSVIQKPTSKTPMFEVGVQAGVYGSVGIGSSEEQASENGAKDIVELIAKKESALNNSDGWQSWENGKPKGKKGRTKGKKNRKTINDLEESFNETKDDSEGGKPESEEESSRSLEEEDSAKGLPKLPIPEGETALEHLCKLAKERDTEAVASLVEKASAARSSYTVTVRMDIYGSAAMGNTEEEARERAAREVLRQVLKLEKPPPKKPTPRKERRDQNVDGFGLKQPTRLMDMPTSSGAGVRADDESIANYLIQWLEGMHKSPVQFLHEWGGMQNSEPYYEQQWVDTYNGSVQFSCTLGGFTGWGFGASKAMARHFSTLNCLVKLYKSGLLHGRKVAPRDLMRGGGGDLPSYLAHTRRYGAYSGYMDSNYGYGGNEKRQKDYSIGGRLSFKLLQDVAKKHDLTVVSETKTNESERRNRRVEVKVNMGTESATATARSRDEAEMNAAIMILKKLKQEKGNDYVFVPRRKKTNEESAAKGDSKDAEDDSTEGRWPPRVKADVVSCTGKLPRVYLPDLCKSRGIDPPSLDIRKEDGGFMAKVSCGEEFSGWGKGSNKDAAEDSACLMVIYEMVSGKTWPPMEEGAAADQNGSSETA